MRGAVTLPGGGPFASVPDGGNRLKYLEGGWWVSYDGDRTIAIHSPIDGSLVGLFPALAQETIDEVFQRAQEAHKGWAEAGLEERVSCLYRAADLMEKHADDFVEVLGWEIAKNRKDAREEATRSAQYLRFTAEEGRRMRGEMMRGDAFAPFARNIDAALGVAHSLEVGSVQINGKSARGSDHFPFIGIKASGMGAQGVRYSIESMTRVKAIVFNLHEWNGFGGL